MSTFTKQTKHTSTFTDRNRDFPGVYNVARFGISTYGTATTGDGLYTDISKHTSTFTRQTKH